MQRATCRSDWPATRGSGLAYDSGVCWAPRFMVKAWFRVRACLCEVGSGTSNGLCRCIWQCSGEIGQWTILVRKWPPAKKNIAVPCVPAWCTTQASTSRAGEVR